VVISMMPLTPEHIFFEYACFRLGILFVPLDVRLKADETIKSVSLLKSARRIMYLHPDDTETEDRHGGKRFYEFKIIARAVRKQCPYAKYFIQFSPEEDADNGTRGWLVFDREMRTAWMQYLENPSLMAQKMAKIESVAKLVKEDDPILIIYTTGTTGFPKPAMLTNVGIVCQNLCLAKGFGMTMTDRMLVNLPPSHVGCQTEQLMTGFFVGNTGVILHGYLADKSLKAIQQYRVTMVGQIPSLFVMEWIRKDYNTYDLSSLRFALYGGQAVTQKFLERLSKMAKNFGTGLGLTESSGFLTYTQWGENVKAEDIMTHVGSAYPISPISIRKPMLQDGNAGEECKTHEIGEVCFTGPQVFKGYFMNEEATRKSISKDGWCYTGDLGFVDEQNNLHLAGRSKFVIKPKGYQVYPPDIEDFISKLPEIANVAVLGAPHDVFGEGIVAFIELRKGKTLTKEAILEHCKGMAAYKRPSLIVFIDEIPLNRVDKTDYAELKKVIQSYVEEERAKGGWDAGKRL
jgi:fatty-acyl-CoA synthase